MTTPAPVPGPAASEGSPGGWYRLTVQAWFVLLLSVIAVLVIVCAMVGASLLHRTTTLTDHLADRVSPARLEAAYVQAALVNQETGVRGYLLTKNPQFLQPYTDGLAEERTRAGRVTALVGDQAQLVADLAAVRAAGDQWRRLYAEPLIAATKAGTPVTEDRVAAGKQAFDHIRALFTIENDHFSSARERARAELSRVQATRDATFGAMLALLLVSGIAVALMLRRAVTRPLNALRAASRAVASGNHDLQIPARGPADISEVARDVETMRRRIVADLQAARRQQDILRRQTADLDAQTIELRRSNSELEQFAYVASHDLQEPLRKIATFCQLIEKRYGDQLDDRGVKYITFAVDGAKRMQVLINDLLTFSRVGRLYDTSKPFSLRQAADKAITNLGSAIEEADARVELPEDLPVVMGDPTLLVMLWQNLLGNAVKFRHPDRAPLIHVGCRRAEDGDMWCLSVTDNGIGILPEFSDKIFVIFQRLHTREAYTGTGIGLALCKKIVEHHGGRIWLDPGHTGGTRFHFTLPALTEAGGTEPGEIALPEGSSV
ncbi:sensor histidine kinase [Sphaerisporangium corydalis]|uniref:histidine kinase n=1 Tax=Sphaerisporangium corydalis TaxID=1441875 RepID=A0ABV9EI53_9ACTN|nr:sensor histidine kinase [Sphaerisporangium corydalis]